MSQCVLLVRILMISSVQTSKTKVMIIPYYSQVKLLKEHKNNTHIEILNKNQERIKKSIQVENGQKQQITIYLIIYNSNMCIVGMYVCECVSI